MEDLYFWYVFGMSLREEGGGATSIFLYKLSVTFDLA